MKLSKVIILGAAIMLSPLLSFSQIGKINLGIGYGIGTHTETGGLSFVIGRYNNTRSYLTKKMEEPKFFHGINIATDWYFGKGLFDIEWTARTSEVYAKGIDNSGVEVRRDFKYNVSSLNCGYGVKLKSKKEGVMGSYLGVDFSMISMNTYTRLYSTSSSEPKYNKIWWQIQIGFSPFIQFVGNRFTTKIQYQWMLGKADFWHDNMAINPATWSGDPFDNIKGKTSSLGICVRYNLFKNKKKEY